MSTHPITHRPANLAHPCVCEACLAQRAREREARGFWTEPTPEPADAQVRSIREIRRKLLAQPGITPLPTCGACQRQVQPRAFGREFCKACEAERAAVSEAWEAKRWAEANPGASFPIPDEPMFDFDDGRPFPEQD